MGCQIRPLQLIMEYVATATKNVHPATKHGAVRPKPRNGDLGNFGLLIMTTLLYRGHDYVQNKKPQQEQSQIKLTYRRNTYLSAISNLKKDTHPELTYRGIKYIK